MDEPLLTPDASRFSFYPIRFPTLYALYQKHLSTFWVPAEVHFDGDVAGWRSLTDAERHFLTTILAFFSNADGVVLENLLSRFSTEVCAPEARAFYSIQSAIECIHSEVYAQMLEVFVEDVQQREQLLTACETIPCVKMKTDWALQWLHERRPFCERVVAFACVEGIMFSASFCAIFFFKNRNLLPGLCTSNEFIARDEALHTEFAVTLHAQLRRRCDAATIRDIIMSAVAVEEQFVDAALPHHVGINADQMKSYVRFVADDLAAMFNMPAIYGDACPFAFMTQIGMKSKVNFFEARNTTYQKSGIFSGKRAVAFTDDF